MKRGYAGRSAGLVSSDKGEQGFWPSYADMMSAIALILFFLMLLSYIQNLINGSGFDNGVQEIKPPEETGIAGPAPGSPQTGIFPPPLGWDEDFGLNGFE